jgi:hypothetical protein
MLRDQKVDVLIIRGVLCTAVAAAVPDPKLMSGQLR